MVNSEVKGTLARLLATENLTVEHRKVSTASFDVNNRVLVLPIWDASATVYDLLVGHEVGHALYTPNLPIDAPKAFVNVVEDARIERMMKVTYPGLRKSFFEGYRELWHQDFFGVADEDINALSFIDRINLYFKGCATLEFTDEEQVYVDRVANTNTFQDVIDLSNDLYAYAKGKEDQKENIAPQQGDMDIEMDLPQDTDEQETITPDNIEGEEQENDDGERGSDGEDSDQPISPADLETPSYEESKGEECDELTSQTEEALRQALETLVNDDDREWVYIDTPEIDVDNVLTGCDEIQEDLYFHFEGAAVSLDDRKQISEYYTQNLVNAKEQYLNAKKEAQRSVNYLVKQFEMRKSADEYKRAAVSKTGVINTNALHKYKLTDDIFKRVTTVKEGKNHGLVMFLDWSGSMQYQLIDTIIQTYNLCWFCKKVGIPFRVYAFQNSHGSSSDIHPGIKNPKGNTLGLCSDFKLLEFFSSRQNAKSLEKSMLYVYCQAYAMGHGGLGYMHKYTLGGTPLSEAVICAPELVKRLRKIENVQKVNVVCLTDGESNPMVYIKEREADCYYGNGEFMTRSIQYSHRNTKFILRDSKTGYNREISPSPYETTREIVSFYREITDYNWVGIRICSKNELKRFMRTLTFAESEILDKQWKKEKFASVKKNAGFTESFYIQDKSLGGDTENLEVKQKGEVATKAELGRAFKKHMSSKMTNKKVLNAFIEQIA
tara:strand:- start:299 stop:2458 length:2160 start_codon:yes stop_codon:yes gene_type:complete